MAMFPFVAARHFYAGRNRPIRLIVVHDMEAPEQATTAESVASYFAGPNASDASAHFCIDNNSVVQCVKAGDTAWAAPGANADGVHLEHAGYARQSRAEWLDPYSESCLNWSSLVAAEVVKALAAFGVDVPVRRLSVPEVAGGVVRGFCGHIDVTRAFRRSSHTDGDAGAEHTAAAVRRRGRAAAG
jgi:hypothetical protein